MGTCTVSECELIEILLRIADLLVCDVGGDALNVATVAAMVSAEYEIEQAVVVDCVTLVLASWAVLGKGVRRG